MEEKRQIETGSLDKEPNQAHDDETYNWSDSQKIWYLSMMIALVLTILLLLYMSYDLYRAKEQFMKEYKCQYKLHNGYWVRCDKSKAHKLCNAEGDVILKADRFFRKPNPVAEDSLWVYVKDGYRGYVNLNNGEVAIRAGKRGKKFNKAWFFDPQTGLAAVQDAETLMLGFINPQGDYVIPPKFQCVYGENYIFRDHECLVRNTDDTMALIDPQGNEILSGYEEISERVNGYRLLRQDGKYGVWCDSLVVPIEYDAIFFGDSVIHLIQGDKHECISTLRT